MKLLLGRALAVEAGNTSAGNAAVSPPALLERAPARVASEFSEPPPAAQEKVNASRASVSAPPGFAGAASAQLDSEDGWNGVTPPLTSLPPSATPAVLPAGDDVKPPWEPVGAAVWRWRFAAAAFAGAVGVVGTWYRVFRPAKGVIAQEPLDAGAAVASGDAPMHASDAENQTGEPLRDVRADAPETVQQTRDVSAATASTRATEEARRQTGAPPSAPPSVAWVRKSGRARAYNEQDGTAASRAAGGVLWQRGAKSPSRESRRAAHEQSAVLPSSLPNSATNLLGSDEFVSAGLSDNVEGLRISATAKERDMGT